MDAAATESLHPTAKVDPPKSQTLEDRNYFKEYVTPALLGISLAIATLGIRHFLTPVEAPKQSSTLTSEPITHPNLAEAEQGTLKISVDKEYKNFINDSERIERTMQWKKMIEAVVSDSRLNIPESEKPYWINTMLGITFVESGGNPKANSGIAFGLTQLQVDTAKDVANQYQIPTYNLFNSWDNLFLGTAHQLNMAKLYGKDLGPWVHHLGIGNMTKAVITYLSSVQKLPLSEIDRLLTDPTNQSLRNSIEMYQITPIKLLSSPAVTGMLKAQNAFDDDTEYYPPRLEAANEVLARGNKPIILGTKG